MTRFAGFCLLTEDVIGLSAFYCGLMGLKADDPADDVHQAVRGEGAAFAIYNNGKVPAGGAPRVNLIFEVDDVDLAFERLLAMGVTVTDPPITRPWGMRNMTFLDPDGNCVTFRHPV